MALYIGRCRVAVVSNIYIYNESSRASSGLFSLGDPSEKKSKHLFLLGAISIWRYLRFLRSYTTTGSVQHIVSKTWIMSWSVKKTLTQPALIILPFSLELAWKNHSIWSPWQVQYSLLSVERDSGVAEVCQELGIRLEPRLGHRLK